MGWWRKAVVVLCLALPPLAAGAPASATYPTTFDPLFALAAKRYLPAPYRDHWLLLKAQCIVESNLRPDAISPAGAQGICQVLRGTARDIERATGLRGSLRDAKHNISLAAAYMRQMLRFWSWDRDPWCRLALAWASYNAGAGNIAKAQVLSNMRMCWDGIAPFLPQVTGKHAAETQAYVYRIMITYLTLKGGF